MHAIDTLSSPFSETAPAGPWRESDPDLDAAFYETKVLVLSSREVLASQRDADAGIEANEARPRTPEWGEVVTGCIDLLRNHTKDLEVVAWLIEGLGHVEGIDGITRGLRLARELSERLWPHLHPTVEDEEDEGPLPRLECLRSLDKRNAQGRILLPLADVPVTRVGAYTLEHVRVAESMVTATAAERAGWTKQGYPSLEHVEDAIRETGPGFYAELEASVRDCERELAALEHALTVQARDTLGADTEIRLEEVRRELGMLAAFTASTRGGLGDANAPTPDATTSRAPAPAASPPEPVGDGVTTRESAIRGLDAIAKYYRKNEPHSPLVCVLEQTVDWARLDISELMKEVITSGSALHVLIKKSCARRSDIASSNGRPSSSDPGGSEAASSTAEESSGGGTSLSRIQSRLKKNDV